MNRVFGWSNAAGGIHHYRIREPLRGLALHGYETRSSPVALVEIFEQYDTVLVRGLHDPKNSMLWRYAAEKKLPALRVYDLDDDIWAWQPGSKEDQYWTDERRLNVELNIQAADLVTTPTHALAELLSQLNPHVAVLPNTIPERLLSLLPERRERFIVGWQGAAQHVRDLQQIYTPILRFMLRHPDVEFHVWGPQGTRDFPDALVSRIRVFPWVQSVWGHYLRLSMDVGLAPLDPSDTFNDTKSDIKLREYAALGIPFIASPGPAYSQTAESARGMVAESPEEWEAALEKLYKDANLRQWMREQGRLRARLWTTENNGIEWKRAYDRAEHTRNLRAAAATTVEFPSPVPSRLIYTNGQGDRGVEDIGADIFGAESP